MAIRLKKAMFAELQDKAGFSDSELARKMGINRSQLWRVKKGLNDPGQAFVTGALRAFPGVKFDDLFFVDDVLRDSHTNDPDVAGTGTDG